MKALKNWHQNRGAKRRVVNRLLSMDLSGPPLFYSRASWWPEARLDSKTGSRIRTLGCRRPFVAPRPAGPGRRPLTVRDLAAAFRSAMVAAKRRRVHGARWMGGATQWRGRRWRSGADLERQTPLAVEVGGEEIALYWLDGAPFATSNYLHPRPGPAVGGICGRRLHRVPHPPGPVRHQDRRPPSAGPADAPIRTYPCRLAGESIEIGYLSAAGQPGHDSAASLRRGSRKFSRNRGGEGVAAVLAQPSVAHVVLAHMGRRSGGDQDGLALGAGRETAGGAPDERRPATRHDLT